MNWKDARKDFEMYLRLEKSLSENSIESYSRDIGKLQVFFAETGKTNPTKIQPDDLKDFVYSVAKLGYADRSQARLISSIKAFYKFLLLEDYMEVNPSSLLEAPKIGKKLPEVLSHDEIERMLAAIDRSNPLGIRNLAILETMYSCGLRVSELINLKLQNVFFDEDMILVTGKGNKERLVPIGATALHCINVYCQEVRGTQLKEKDQEVLFLNNRGNGLTRVMVFYIIKDLAQKAGIQKTVSPHTFRHSFATELVNAGANLRAVQQMLGHESITTTEIYTHLDNQYLRDTIEMYHPRIRK